jgi:hypothetical protein
MTTIGILRITRWIAFGLIALIALGIGFVEFDPWARLERRALPVADNAQAETLAVRSGVSIGGLFDLIDQNGRFATG